MPAAYAEEIIVVDLAIRDITLHDPSTDPTTILIIDTHSYGYAVIKFENDHDQIVRAQVMGNIGRSGQLVAASALVNPDRLGAAIDIQAADSETRLAGENDLSLVPLLYVELTALVLPTTGTIRVTVHLFGQRSGMD